MKKWTIGILFLSLSTLPLEAESASVTLAWDPSTGTVDGYRLYYDSTPGPYYTGDVANEGSAPVDIPIATIDPTAPRFTLTGIPSCQHYYFAVSTYNTAGESGLSEEVDGTVIYRPEALQLAPGPREGTLAISWADIPASDGGTIAGFRVYYDLDSGEPYEGTSALEGPSPVEAASGATELQLSGLPADATVYVRVETLCPDGATRQGDEASGQVAAPLCGNGILETGETCDPPGSCPSCDDGSACTLDQPSGAADSCDLSCGHTLITSCEEGDGCCPQGCDSDSDCSPSCGNGMLDSQETCDPPESCPQHCNDGNTCTVGTLAGSAAACSAECSYVPITACEEGDGCCPPGCDEVTDPDCLPGADSTEESPGSSPSSSEPLAPGERGGTLIGGCSVADGGWSPGGLLTVVFLSLCFLGLKKRALQLFRR